jgi:hypothetical protein
LRGRVVLVGRHYDRRRSAAQGPRLSIDVHRRRFSCPIGLSIDKERKARSLLPPPSPPPPHVDK